MKFTYWKSGLLRCGQVLGALLLLAASTYAQQFATPSSVIAAGGGSSAGGNFALVTTIGQAAPGRQVGGNFTLEAGFIPIITVLQTPGAPMLGIRFDTGAASLTWADSPTGFTLEGTATPHLPSSWLPHVGLPTLTNGTNSLNVPLTPPHHFFRLRSQ